MSSFGVGKKYRRHRRPRQSFPGTGSNDFITKLKMAGVASDKPPAHNHQEPYVEPVIQIVDLRLCRVRRHGVREPCPGFPCRPDRLPPTRSGGDALR